MKELSIEEKARAYDKALERAQALYNDKNEIGYANAESVLEEVFPLLKEPEDERIRKEIINYFAKGKEYLSFCSIGKDDILAWLEKQGETVWSEETDDDAWLNDIISKVESGCTLNSSEIKWLKSIKDKINIHYWTEEEIEPIISDYLRGAEHYGGMIGRLRCLKPKSLEKQGTSYTKSDVDDAYLKGISDAKNELEKQGEQKPAWSEEDETRLQACIDCLQAESLTGKVDTVMTNWLKSLKDRYTWKPSIAQLNALSIVSKGNAPDDIEAIVSLYNDLKKLTE